MENVQEIEHRAENFQQSVIFWNYIQWRSVAWGDYAEFDPVRSFSYKVCLHLSYEKCFERAKKLSNVILDWVKGLTSR